MEKNESVPRSSYANVDSHSVSYKKRIKNPWHLLELNMNKHISNLINDLGLLFSMSLF